VEYNIKIIKIERQKDGWIRLHYKVYRGRKVYKCSVKSSHVSNTGVLSGYARKLLGTTIMENNG